MERGDRVAIYLGMVPELPIAMLACARIGAAHSVVFGGFSSTSLADRIDDAACKVLITARRRVAQGPGRAAEGQRRRRARTEQRSRSSTCVVLRRTGHDVAWTEGRDAGGTS